MQNKALLLIFAAGLLLGSIALPSFGEEAQIDTSSPFLSSGSDKKISMDFQNAPLVDVLKIFSQQSSFNLVTAEEIANKRVTVYLDNVPVNEALSQILRANSLTYELQPDTNIYIVKSLTPTDTEIITRVYQLKNATVDSAKINGTLSISGVSGGGGKKGSAGSGIVSAISSTLTAKGKVIEDPRTNSLMITDIASNFKKIEQTIAKLDVPVTQILIEVEMLEVSKGTTDLIGVKMGTTPLTFSGGQALTPFPFNGLTPIFDHKGGADYTDARFTAGTFDATGMTAIVQFLKTQTDARTLARPRIMTLNNEPAEIKISTDEAIGLSSTTTSSQNLATSTATFERKETGVFLTVTPQANAETGEITIAVVPKVIVAKTGGTFGSGTQTQTSKDPEERVSQSILRVHSGETIIIGGLLRNDTSNTTTKVPFLGDLPVVGAAFRHKNATNTQSELIIFITPHIMDYSYSNGRGNTKNKDLLREQNAPLTRLQEIEKEALTREAQK